MHIATKQFNTSIQFVQVAYWATITTKKLTNVFNVETKIVLFAMIKIQVNVMYVKVDITRTKIKSVFLMKCKS